MAEVKKTTVFNDAVHMSMEFSAPLVAIIHTPEMQRLKDLKQLGGVFMVYPAASHNRFEHSLGVCHLAGVMIKELKDRQPDLNITDKDVLMVQIAGLCHDLGHGPFSHLFDNNFLPALRGKKDIKHEQISRRMFDHMVKSNPHVRPALEKVGIMTADLKTIMDLFHFDEEKYESTMLPEKEFLYEIVANNRNGVDVDKWDYFKRDAKQLGMDTAFDHNRLMKFCSVIKNHENHESHICFRDKEAYNVYQMFVTRQVLHRQAYQHKTAKAAEAMILKGLLAAADFIKIPYRLEDQTVGELSLTQLCSVDKADDMNMDAYVKLTDNIYNQILASEDEDLESARAWFKDLQKRKIYRLVVDSPPINDEKFLEKKNLEVEVRDAIVKNVEQEPDHELLLEESPFYNEGYCMGTHEQPCKRCPKYRFIVQTQRLDFGGKSGDPFEHITFYRKGETAAPVTVVASQISTFFPQHKWAEMKIRVLLHPSCDKETDEKVHALLLKGFAKWYKDAFPQFTEQVRDALVEKFMEELEKKKKELKNKKKELEERGEELENVKKGLEELKNVKKGLFGTFPFYKKKYCKGKHEQPCPKCRSTVQTYPWTFDRY